MSEISDGTSENRGSSSVGRRITSLDGLRGLMAALVVLGHLNTFADGNIAAGSLLTPGFRVPAFFALSGFVLYFASAGSERIEMRTRFGDFLQKRLLRLLPAYYASLILGLMGGDLIALLHLSHHRGGGLHDNAALLSHLLMIHSWYANLRFTLNPPCWMLGYEWVISLCLPLLLGMARRLGWIGMLSVVGILALPVFAGTVGQVVPPGFLLSFVFGVAAARMARRVPASYLVAGRINLSWLTLITAISSAIISLIAITYRHILPLAWAQAASGMTIAAVCLYLTYRPTSWSGKFLSVSPLQYLGRISYSLFLVHYPILTYACWICNHWNIRAGSPIWWAAFVTAVAGSIGLAEISYRLLEVGQVKGTSRPRTRTDLYVAPLAVSLRRL